MTTEPGRPWRVMIDARYIREQSSGIGRYTEHIIPHLLDLDPQLSLRLITHPSKPHPFSHPRVTCAPFDAAPNSIATRLRLARAVDLRGVDLFHSPFNLLPARLSVPSVFTLHDIMWLLDPRYCAESRLLRTVLGGFYGHVIPRSAAEATRIMTVSHHSRESIEARFPDKKDRVHVTYNGLDAFFKPLPPEDAWSLISRHVPPRRRFVLVVGQGSPYKNHVGAIGGFLEAFRDDPSVYLVLVRRFTRGPSRELERLMRDPMLNTRLITLDYISGLELRALYSAASCFLFPSIYEGFGLPPLEAMACGTPVVSSNVGAIAEVCGDGAEQVDPHDVSAIARGLRRVMYDAPHAKALRQRGFARAATFTWRRSAEQVLACYRLAIQDAAAGQGSAR